MGQPDPFRPCVMALTRVQSGGDKIEQPAGMIMQEDEMGTRCAWKSGSRNEETRVRKVESIRSLNEGREPSWKWPSGCHAAGSTGLRWKSGTTIFRH